ncbi:hypothetical protein RB2083_801 [Rhodobacteraceae bacterium HTCC2083]|nr:hypothetical protein RB2083_801 [Rhodobacteraceae bacterium HTCC2083]
MTANWIFKRTEDAHELINFDITQLDRFDFNGSLDAQHFCKIIHRFPVFSGLA